MKNKDKYKAQLKTTTFKQSHEGKVILDKMANQDYIDRSRFIRRLIADEAERRGIELPEVVKYETT